MERRKLAIPAGISCFINMVSLSILVAVSAMNGFSADVEVSNVSASQRAGSEVVDVFYDCC